MLLLTLDRLITESTMRIVGSSHSPPTQNCRCALSKLVLACGVLGVCCESALTHAFVAACQLERRAGMPKFETRWANRQVGGNRYQAEPLRLWRLPLKTPWARTSRKRGEKALTTRPKTSVLCIAEIPVLMPRAPRPRPAKHGGVLPSSRIKRWVLCKP